MAKKRHLERKSWLVFMDFGYVQTPTVVRPRSLPLAADLSLSLYFSPIYRRCDIVPEGAQSRLAIMSRFSPFTYLFPFCRH